MAEIKLSEYNIKIFEWVKEGTPGENAVVEAIAGSGKSFSIVKAIEYIPSDKRIMFLAYNKSTVEELKKRIKDTPNFTIRTSHSLGYAMLKTHFKYQETTPDLEVNEYKYRNYFKQMFVELTGDIEFANKEEREEFKETILGLIDICRVYLCETEEDICKIADKYSYRINNSHSYIIHHLIEWGKQNLDTVDYTDMICLPNYFNLNINSMKYDWVIVDEVQDQNIAMQKLFLKCIKKKGKFLGVGDRKQSIMGFSGANDQAFNELLKIPNTIPLDLSINYRCPQAVLPVVKTFVPQFQLRDEAPKGKFLNDVLVKDIKPNSMVLCRNTAPLIKLYLQLIRKNIKCYIKGMDIASSLITLIEQIDLPYIQSDLKMDGIIPRLYRKLFESRNNLMAKTKIDIYDATLERTIQQRLETISTIKVLSEGLIYTNQLTDRIKKIFKQTEEDGICLITCHKAKGMEHENVYLLCPSLIPSKQAKKDWEVESEKNLLYVTYTRTKNIFGTISEKDFPPPFENRDVKDVVKELSNIEIIVNKIFKPRTEEKKETIKSDKVYKMENNKSGKSTESIEINNSRKEVYERELNKFTKVMKGRTIGECYDIFNDFNINNTIRVVESDGKSMVVTCDYVPGRISVALEKNVIIGVTDIE
jgi:superfamily I DNA/RNA helicase